MKKLILLNLLVFSILSAYAQKYELSSPDGKLKAGIEINAGINVTLDKGSETVMKFGNISLETDNKLLQKTGYKVQKTVRRSVNEIVRPQIREKAEAFNNIYNELDIRFKAGNSVTFRLFNEGLAYRLSTSLKDSLYIYNEHLDIHFEPGDSARFQSSPTFSSAWETPYEFEKLAGISDGKLCCLPFLVQKHDGPFVMITETDLYDYPGLWLKGTGQTMLSAVNPPFPKTLSFKGSIFDHGQVAEAEKYIARVKGTRTYPWRIFAVADDEKGLVANNMVWLLASPSVLDDISWIKPGVVMFDWWAKFNIYGVDFKSGINTATAKYFVDFCALHGFRYFLFDDGWCPEEDLLHPKQGLNMGEVTEYARSKGVDIMLWVLWHSLQKQWDEAFTQFKKWRVKGIKIDFMNRDDQPMVEFYEAAARRAAEEKMVVDFHGAFKPSGLNRKYPNTLTREALIEFEYNGWTQYDTPVHHNLLPYIRMFTGAMDYIPATMRNSTKDNFRPIADYPMGQGTRAHSIALFVVLNSPLTMLPDSPSDYYREKECTEFLMKLPVVWDETRLLKGKIAEYTVMARRSGADWFIGAITNWNRRSMDLETGFLAPGKYRLEAIMDGLNADSRAEDYIKKEISFNAGDVLKLNLASGGGWVAHISPLSGCSSSGEKSSIKSSGREVITFRVLPFRLSDVKLLDGPFLRATELGEKTLLNYEPDRLLSRFYTEAGIKPKAEHYMGWENESLAGHSLGHYLSACSMMYLTTSDRQFLDRVNYIVDELKFLQDKGGNGYIGAFTNGKKVFEEEVSKGNIRSKGFDLNGIWSPFYTQHKVMAGLRDAYRCCGNVKALEVEKKFADWIGSIVSSLNESQIQEMLKCEYGGINETLADLYADTGDEKYLRLSGVFYQKAVLDSLKAGIDVLPGKHCNTNIPKLIGLSRVYELSGNTSDRQAAEFFWKTVVSHHSYVTGGNGDNEYFGPAGRLRNRLDSATTESCNVYNMLKLTEHLFEWEPSAEEADYYERALFNHILSSQDPVTGNVTYNLSLDMGGFKAFQDPFDFTCCIGTGMENHSKYGQNIYYHNDDELYVFQYIASELSWKEKGLTLIQKTSYPVEQGAAFEFGCANPLKLALQIRYPSWARNGIEIRINGNTMHVKQEPGSFVAIKRTWRSGDRVEVKIPFTLRLETMPDDSNRVAVMYGPLVMAGDLGPLKDSASKDAMYVPVLMTENRDPSSWMKAVDGKPNTFITVGTGKPRDVKMRPFYSFSDRRYTVYWDLFNEARFKEGWEEYRGAKSQLSYSVSMADPSMHYFHVELNCSGWNKDTLDFKMPRWTPGYYQIMDYAKEVANISAKDRENKTLPVIKTNGNSWQIKISKGTPFSLSYDIKADRKFVANNYLDSTHGYIVPAATFLYIDGCTSSPVSVKVILNKQWNKIATGLDPVPGSTTEFYSPDFDILYDCPILIGKLEEIPPFYVNGVEHRFIGYNIGNFDKVKFISNLKAAVQAGVDITGDVPYKQFTFIGIGPGFGGIEHLNNTTVSFNGNGLDKPEGMNRMMNFLAHEYFHNYNVKRIRPYELGPFDYDRENKTNLLWESEGLTVYYEYLIVKRAGLVNEKVFFNNLEGSINAFENSPGRVYQSLIQASFMTWSEGPFGRQGEDASKSISYYDKGPVVGMVLDFAIRNATRNKKSLDDVMRLLYREYYKKLQRGFTDAEFQQACESVAGRQLNQEFEYINTAKEIDYTKYLAYAGLKSEEVADKESGKRKIVLSRMGNVTPLQSEILKSWLGE